MGKFKDAEIEDILGNGVASLAEELLTELERLDDRAIYYNDWPQTKDDFVRRINHLRAYAVDILREAEKEGK